MKLDCFSISYLPVFLLMGFFPPVIPLLSLCFFFLFHLSTGLTLPAPSLALASCALSLPLFSHCSVTGNICRSSSFRAPLQEALPSSVKQIYVTILAESFSWKPFFCKNWFSPDISCLLHFCCFFFCENWSWLFLYIPLLFLYKGAGGFNCCPSLHLPHISLCRLLN